MTRVGVAVAAVLAALAALAPAWACVPQPTITSVQPRASGPAGAEVTVAGENFEDGPVELRWNEVQGPLLGESDGPAFSIPVTVPDDPEGLYVLIALSRQAGGGVGATARTSFLVGEPAAPSATTQPAKDSEPAPPAQTGWPATPVLAGVALVVFAGGGLAGWGCARGRRDRG